MTFTTQIKAVTLDLDDTLWPIWPTIERAEAALHDWLAVHAPATATVLDKAQLRALRNAIEVERPDLRHDLSAFRREAIRRALVMGGDDEALVEPAFEVFFAARQQVTLFDDALPALEWLAARYPVVALTNGNADVGRVGLGKFFVGAVSAKDFGVPKPDPRIFHEACRVAGHAPASVLHVGDDWALDVEGAVQAGMQTAFLNRQKAEVSPSFKHVRAFENLHQLIESIQLHHLQET